MASLFDVSRGKMPVIFLADRPTDINEAIAFAEEMKLKPVILGGGDDGQIAPFLKQHNVPVLLTGIMDLPSRENDPCDVNFAPTSKLKEAGVTFTILSGDAGAEARILPYTAGIGGGVWVVEGRRITFGHDLAGTDFGIRRQAWHDRSWQDGKSRDHQRRHP